MRVASTDSKPCSSTRTRRVSPLPILFAPTATRRSHSKPVSSSDLCLTATCEQKLTARDKLSPPSPAPSSVENSYSHETGSDGFAFILALCDSINTAVFIPAGFVRHMKRCWSEEAGRVRKEYDNTTLPKLPRRALTVKDLVLHRKFVKMYVLSK